MAYRAIRWHELSLRNKLTLVIVGLLTLGIVVAGIGTTLMLRPTLVSQLDSQLASVAVDPVSVVGGDPTTGRFSYDHVRQAPQPYYVAVIGERGQVLVDNWGTRPRAIAPVLEQAGGVIGFADAAPEPADGPPAPQVFEMSDGLGSTWRAIAVPNGSYRADQVQGTLVIALPLSSVNATMASFLAIFFGFGLTVVIFGAALTRLLVSATLQPLRVVESTAMSFAAGDYAQRLPESTPNTEVGRLSRSLNIMLGRIDSALDERNATIGRMRRFVGDASHELRTPLVTVRGYAELYRMGALDEPAKVAQAMDRIEKEALRMGGLVEDLLQLARLDETRALEKQLVDLEPIAEDAAMDARAQSPKRPVRALPTRVILTQEGSDLRRSGGTEVLRIDDAGAGVETANAGGVAQEQADAADPEAATAPAKSRRRWADALRPPPLPKVSREQLTRILRRKPAEPADGETVDDLTRIQVDGDDGDDGADIPAMVLGNEDKMRQAVSNIIGNALRYTADDSPLDIGVVIDVPRRTATVEIIDHGEGVPPEVREKIFERFWRADTSRARETGGSGLGLAIVTAIMRAHEGTVDVVDTPGGGATFRLAFPLLVADAVDDEPSTAPADADATAPTDS